MHSGGQPQKPFIAVISCGDPDLDHEVLAGIEEEGVPSNLDRRHARPADADADALSLARAAAQTSPLEVGVGIDSTGEVCVHHEKLAEPMDGLSYRCAGADRRTPARTAGHNAARLVIGLPLRSIRT